jgi:KDO2-lipid IV(A) lauroyltransferase
MIGYIFFRLSTALFSAIPFAILYKISDFLSWFLYNAVRYRRDVVEKQLKASFPEKTDDDLTKIAKKSYANLGDIIVESLKGFTMPKSEFLKRYHFVNPELSLKYTQQGRCVIHSAAHYGNWEWGVITYALSFPIPSLGFYKPLSNKYSEKYAAKKRGRFGFIMVPIQNTSKAFDQYKNDGATFVLVSDQSTWSDNAHWVNFLGQDTACPPGADKYSRKLSCPVFYVHIQRMSRGHYDVTLHELTDGTEELAEGIVTQRFMKKLESILQERPEDWIWSHKRWKNKRVKEQ